VSFLDTGGLKAIKRPRVPVATTSPEEASEIIIKGGEREASNEFLQMVSDEVK
jgi:hypothetical protein